MIIRADSYRRILDQLAVHGLPLDDDDLAARLGVARQAVNQSCRRLVERRLLVREDGRNGKLVNRLLRAGERTSPAVRQPFPIGSAPEAMLTEDEVKQAVREHLEAQGYEVTVAWARTRGIDLDAHKPDRVIVEAKGEVALQPQQVNYFLGALGELLQRMNDPDARYGLALPDNRQYRGLVDRLPKLAKQRLGLRVYFVRRQESGLTVEEVE